MARIDLLKKLFTYYQKRDDDGFRAIADEIIADERRKQHTVGANELERILRNDSNGYHNGNGHYSSLHSLAPPPLDADRKTHLFEIRQPSRFIDDIVLDKRVHALVMRVMEEYRQWEVLEANGLVPSNRLLFCGPSGCGKTATAEAIASEIGIPLIYVRFDAVVSSLLGETAANIRKVFDYARRGQWVILFDEFDAIGRSRDDVTEHGEIKRVVNSFLQILDSFKGRSLIIAATNFEQALDPAIWRRYDEVVRFELPDEFALCNYASKLLSRLRVNAMQVDILVAGFKGGSYADLERACLEIRKTCILRGHSVITDNDIIEAVERQRYRFHILERANSAEVPTVDQE